MPAQRASGAESSTPRDAGDLTVVDIGTLLVVPPGPLGGARMRDVETIRDAALLARDGRIAWFGAKRDLPDRAPEPVVSAAGGCLIPGLIDPHTHIPFAGQRAGEFVRRIAGESYLSILESGGGIRETCAAVRAASEAELVAENLPRLRRMLAAGVTTVECKSGYGLSPGHELKQLRAIRSLQSPQPVTLVPTYLGAHAVPAEFDGRPDEFLERIGGDDVLAGIGREHLAHFCDVFCDRGAFDVTQSRRHLERAAVYGLRAKLHADELAQIGASRLAGELRAISADHLEHIDEGGIAALQSAGTVAVLLPGTSFFLGIAHAPARKLIDAGISVAIGTDFNPGSCAMDSLPLAMNIACCQMRMTPTEALVACTANAAAALDRQRRAGAIATGLDADLVILETASIDEWMYWVARPQVRAVIKAGRVVWTVGAGAVTRGRQDPIARSSS
jgi:imidazolonepropionase